MKFRALCLLAAMALAPGQAAASQDDAVKALSAELKAHTPANWEVRVRWRDGQLLASITPWPYQAAFQLWYNSSKMAETLNGLCPKPDEEVWKLLKADQTVVLEPTVGGKSMIEARVACPRVHA